MMKKQQKKPYEKPCMQHFLVEAEDPICSGSVDLTATSPGGASIEAQQVNKDFASDNDFITNNEGWDNIPTN